MTATNRPKEKTALRTEARRVDVGGVLSVVQEHVGEILGLDRNAMPPDAVLLDLGAQSVDFMALKYRLDRHFQITLPEVYATPDVHTIATFARAIAVRLGGRRARAVF